MALLFFMRAAVDVVADTALRAVTLTPQQARYDAFNSARAGASSACFVLPSSGWPTTRKCSAPCIGSAAT